MEERWKSIVGYEGIYEVSDLGRVRRIDGHYKSHATDGILHPSLSGRYASATLFKDGQRRYHSVHALVMAAFVGQRPSGAHVDHKDGNKKCNELSNLEYVTPKENVRRQIKRTLRTQGRRNSICRLTETDVNEIRRLAANGMTLAAIGRQFGIVRTHISFIVSGQKWRESYA